MNDQPIRIVLFAIVLLCMVIACIEGQMWATGVAGISFMTGYGVRALQVGA